MNTWYNRSLTAKGVTTPKTTVKTIPKTTQPKTKKVNEVDEMIDRLKKSGGGIIRYYK